MSFPERDPNERLRVIDGPYRGKHLAHPGNWFEIVLVTAPGVTLPVSGPPRALDDQRVTYRLCVEDNEYVWSCAPAPEPAADFE